jgi:hypothetical protein
VLQTLSVVRRLRRKQDRDIRGRLTSPEEDLLRAAVVFTGAGLDATLKQLIRDTLPTLLETNDQAHEKFETFAADRLGSGETADYEDDRAASHVADPPDTLDRGLRLRLDGAELSWDASAADLEVNVSLSRRATSRWVWMGRDLPETPWKAEEASAGESAEVPANWAPSGHPGGSWRPLRGLSHRRSAGRVPSLPYETRPQTAARRAAVLERSWNAAAATGSERRQGQDGKAAQEQLTETGENTRQITARKLSRRRSRVRVPSLPSLSKCLQMRFFVV